MVAMKEGLLEPIDTNIVDLSNHAFPEWQWPSALGTFYYFGGIAYRPSSHGDMGKHPRTWPEYWDGEGIPGAVVVCVPALRKKWNAHWSPTGSRRRIFILSTRIGRSSPLIASNPIASTGSRKRRRPFLSAPVERDRFCLHLQWSGRGGQGTRPRHGVRVRQRRLHAALLHRAQGQQEQGQRDEAHQLLPHRNGPRGMLPSAWRLVSSTERRRPTFRRKLLPSYRIWMIQITSVSMSHTGRKI